ncbi:MAG: NIL domain-containing protein [Syntrophales bacterium]|nr:NIL domain-containing protein [Syntrophales bacterium]MDD5234277.1 NIL domain-containing protein [Syntrophales bacterium]MDD5531912.1 NIL domain-containing protein [Syntrophales bacterium]HPL64100.1 NIL domain-containing protein [Syntrophales bacterium]
MDAKELFTKKVVIRYPADIVDQPIVYRLVKDFDLMFNILKARISPRREGLLVLELFGTSENFERGIRFLKEKGLKVEPLSKSVTQDLEKCVHCGACLAFCPASAVSIDPVTAKVIFDPEKCSGCEICVTACPSRAMVVDLF